MKLYIELLTVALVATMLSAGCDGTPTPGGYPSTATKDIAGENAVPEYGHHPYAHILRAEHPGIRWEESANISELADFADETRVLWYTHQYKEEALVYASHLEDAKSRSAFDLTTVEVRLLDGGLSANLTPEAFPSHIKATAITQTESDSAWFSFMERPPRKPTKVHYVGYVELAALPGLIRVSAETFVEDRKYIEKIFLRTLGSITVTTL